MGRHLYSFRDELPVPVRDQFTALEQPRREVPGCRVPARNRSDGQVEEIGKPLCGAPACFAERGRVHVGVKSYGKTEGSPYAPSKIEVRPGAFRGDRKS